MGRGALKVGRRARGAWMWAVAVAAAVVGLCGVGSASPAAGASSVAPGHAAGTGGAASGHGWLVVQTVDAGTEGAGGRGLVGREPRPAQFALVHVPPRGASGAASGSAESARLFFDRPVALAADEDTVFIIRDVTSEGVVSRHVESVRASPTPIEGVWAFEPAGRTRVHPMLEPSGRVLGAAAHGGRLLVLRETDEGPRLHALERNAGAWTDAALPEGVDAGVTGGAGATRLTLVGGETAALVRHTSRGWEAWEATADGWQRMPLHGSSDGANVGGAVGLGAVGPGVVGPGAVPIGTAASGVVWLDERAAGTDGGIWAGIVGPDAVQPFPTLPRPAGDLSAVVLAGASPRLVLVGAARAGAPGDGAPGGQTPGGAGRVGGGGIVGAAAGGVAPGRTFRVVEVSLTAGEVLAEGPVQRSLPVDPAEFRLLAVMLVALMATALIVVLRPAADSRVLVLPERVALAGSARRLVAALLDGVLVVSVGARLLGVDPQTALGAEGVFQLASSWTTIPAMMGLGALYGTLSESVFGRTLGKAVVGCAVIAVGPGPGAGSGAGAGAAGAEGGAGAAGAGRESMLRRLPLAACMARNAVKWVLPPVAALVLFEPAGRHRGDVLAGAAVVVRREPEGAGPGGGGSNGDDAG